MLRWKCWLYDRLGQRIGLFFCLDWMSWTFYKISSSRVWLEEESFRRICAFIIGLGFVFFPLKASAQVTMQVNGAELATVVQSIARSEGLSIMGTESLKGKVTARLQGLSGKEAIEELARLKHFSLRQVQGVLVVDGAGLGEKDSRYTLLLEPKHISPDALLKALAVVVPKEHMELVPGANQIALSVTPAQGREVERLQALLDKQPEQIQLEVSLVALEHSYSKETGIHWSWLGPRTSGSETGKTSTTGTSDTSEYTSLRFGHASLGQAYEMLLKPTISANETDGKTLLLARPSVMTENGEEAKILIGDRVPVTVESVQDGISRTSVSYHDAGIRLHCKPYVMPDKSIDVEITAEVSNPTLVSELKAYKFTTREAHTRVRLQPDEVLVIGGLMDQRKGTQVSKFPLLGDIPLLGKLFRHAKKTKDRVELLIIVQAKAKDAFKETGAFKTWKDPEHMI
ncbi:MAG: type II and III secretion system protein [Veillonellaceae bacterium]|nr:type II and III secretion system protein [Veillonellaceae bacterium]